MGLRLFLRASCVLESWQLRSLCEVFCQISPPDRTLRKNLEKLSKLSRPQVRHSSAHAHMDRFTPYDVRVRTQA